MFIYTEPYINGSKPVLHLPTLSLTPLIDSKIYIFVIKYILFTIYIIIITHLQTIQKHGARARLQAEQRLELASARLEHFLQLRGDLHFAEGSGADREVL
jgi:hypothetical protein